MIGILWDFLSSSPTLLMKNARALPAEDIAEYPEEHDRFTADIEPYLYALRIEKYLLSEYATRMGIEGDISLLRPRRAGSKLTDSGKVVPSHAKFDD